MALESLPKIAPALFSAEQDLIQIYNKKSDTTGVINPSYIKSSPSGVAGAIQFSDGSAFASSSNLTWNNATNALGLGSGTTSAFIDFASNPAGSTTTVGAIRTYVDGVNLSEVMTFREDGRLTIYNTLKSIYDNYSDLGTNAERFANVYALSGRFTNVSTNTLGPLGAATWINISSSVFSLVGGQLSIKGSGSTSATTSLLVQNSAGTELFRVRDDGNFNLAQGRLNWGSIGFGSYIQSDGYDMIYNTRQDSKVHLFYVGGNPVLGINRYSATDYRVFMGIGSGNEASAILEVRSSNQGFLPPRMTDAQIRAIASPAEGLIAYNTTISHLCCYQAGAWVKFSHSPM